MSTGLPKDHLPPEGEIYDRPDHDCMKTCCISGVCCKGCWLCSGPRCFPATFLRNAVSRDKARFTSAGFNLDLIYLTPQIVVHGFPAVGPEVMWRNPRSELQRFFDTRHPNSYRIYNLACEPGRVYGRHEFHGNVRWFPFLDHNAPTLAMMVDFCEDAAAFMSASPANVVGIHCKAGKGRSGLMACCLLLRMGLVHSAAEAMDYYDARRVKKGKKGLTVPTQRRYVRYYDRLLACGVHDSAAVVEPTRRLVKVVLHSYPGESPERHSLDIRIHSGVTKDVLVHEGSTAGPGAVFDCNCDVTGNVYVEVRNNGAKIADCWFNTLFVGRRAGKERIDTDGVAVVAVESAAEAAAEHLEGESPVPIETKAAAPAAEAPQHVDLDHLNVGLLSQAARAGDSKQDAPVTASAGHDDPENLVVMEKLELDKFKKDRKHKKASADYKVVFHFEPLAPPPPPPSIPAAPEDQSVSEIPDIPTAEDATTASATTAAAAEEPAPTDDAEDSGFVVVPLAPADAPAGTADANITAL